MATIVNALIVLLATFVLTVHNYYDIMCFRSKSPMIKKYGFAIVGETHIVHQLMDHLDPCKCSISEYTSTLSGKVLYIRMTTPLTAK